MSENVIEVKDLVKKYGDLTAVNGISFEVHAGEVFSILGPNGAGKTTTVEIMECLRTPTSGSVKVLGHDINQQQKDIKTRIGVLPQDFHSYDLLTVKESIDYFAGLYEKNLPTDDLIKAVNLEEKRNELFKNLSGGLKQRVGVAISMANDPDIIFLDEPTTGLDPKARREVWDVIRNLKSRNKTVILTTHYMEEAEVLSDRVAIMNSGRFIAFGTPKTIIEEHGIGSLCIIKGGSQAAKDALAGAGLAYELKNNDLWIHVEDKTVLPRIVKTLSDSGSAYDEILLKRSTLEDVFLRLTGRKISEEVES
jgi:ABC-2 type transport system ATP-binding protein